MTQGPKSAEDIEKEQEAKLKAKYQNMGAKKKLMPKVIAVFASVATHVAQKYMTPMTTAQVGFVGSQIL